MSFALTLSQPVFAVLRNGLKSCGEAQKQRCHQVWHVVHAVTGYGALICALAAVALGIEECVCCNSTRSFRVVEEEEEEEEEEYDSTRVVVDSSRVLVLVLVSTS